MRTQQKIQARDIFEITHKSLRLKVTSLSQHSFQEGSHFQARLSGIKISAGQFQGEYKW